MDRDFKSIILSATMLVLPLLFLFEGLTTSISSEIQEFYFPLENHKCDDFSSPFGARNRPPDGYDFHEGIDIGRATPGDQIVSYEFSYIESVIENQINLIYWDDDSGWREKVQYNHVNPNGYVTGHQKEWINAGVILGTLQDQGTNTHLDIRYFPETFEEGYQDENARHPGPILAGFDGRQSGPLVIVNGEEYSDSNCTLDVHNPDPNDPHEPQRRFLEVGVRVDQDELDILRVAFTIMGWGAGAYQGESYFTDDILYNPNGDLIASADVDFAEWTNCGDKDGLDSDKGHWAKYIGILPKVFNRTDPFHTVYFRYYLNDEVWNRLDLSSVRIYVEFRDFYDQWNTNLCFVNNNPVCTPTIVQVINPFPDVDPKTQPNKTRWAYLTFQPCASTMLYLLHWQFGDKCYNACTTNQPCQNGECVLSERQTMIDVDPYSIGSSRIYDLTDEAWYNYYEDTKSYYWDNNCWQCDYHEHWVQVAGTYLQNGQIELYLWFPVFWGHDAEFTFKMASVVNGVAGPWSNSMSCTVIDDPSLLYLTYPVGGEAWYAGTKQTITWKSLDYSDPVLIHFSNGVNDWQLISDGATENDGEFEWYVPRDIVSDSCRILIEDAACYEPKDKSDYFSVISLPTDTVVNQLRFSTSPCTINNVYISPQMTVQTQNASGEICPVIGQDVTITFSSSSFTGEFSLNANPVEPITSTILKDGSYSVDFYYRNCSEGDFIITVGENPDRSWMDGQQIVHITDADRVEAENMRLNEMQIIAVPGASNGQVVQPSAPYGSATYDFFGETGEYKIVVRYWDEPNGASEGLFKVNGLTMQDWYYEETPADSPAVWREKQLAITNLVSGDEISFRIYPNGGELGWFDYVKITAYDTIPPSMTAQSVDSLHIDVQYSEQVVGADNANHYAISPALGTITVSYLLQPLSAYH